jgi:hypothetical protein
MNHTGVWDGVSPRAALRKGLWDRSRLLAALLTVVLTQAIVPPDPAWVHISRAASAYAGWVVMRKEAQPREFEAAVAGMRAAVLRPEISCEEMPAPQRIAPYASALSADVTVDEVDAGTGRLILLHDPEGNEAWAGGTFRCVLYARADIDPEMITDALLGGVGWTWLTEALEMHEAPYEAISGTVTRVATENFGSMEEEDATAQIEIRASWSPVPDASGHLDLRPHVEAWGELLCTAAGLPPVPEGVAILPSRRGQRG